jgi:cytidylyltransferase family
MSDKLKNLIIRAITGVFFVVAMVLGILHPHGLIALFALITGLSVWEYTGLVNNIKGVKVNRFISTIAGVYFFLSVAGLCVTPIEGFIVFVPYVLTIIYMFISELYLKNENPVNSWAYTMLGQMYIVLPFSLINVLAFQQVGPGQITFDFLLPLSIFIFLWTNDTGAYVCGSLFGKHKLFPRISPKKSWEGSIGGGILVLIVAGFIGYFANNSGTPHVLSIPAWVGLGLVVVFFGTWGDLVESLLKRTLGVKDSGNILPGHGGMLDRFDSSLLAIPAAVVYLYTLTFWIQH